MDALPSRLDIAAGLGQRIREEREERGWSLELLAGLASIGKSTLGQIEIGQNAPQIDTLMRIAAALGVAVDQLLPDRYLDTMRPKVLAGPRAGATRSRRSSPASNRAKKALAVVVIAGGLLGARPSVEPAQAASRETTHQLYEHYGRRRRRAA